MSRLLAQFGDKGLQPDNAPFGFTSNPSDVAGSNASVLITLENFISQLLGFLTVLASLFFIVYFVMGAFKWTAAGGEASKVQKARDQMIQGVLGLILIVGSYAIIGVIGTLLGLDILSPSEQIQTILNMGRVVN